jgi:ribosomal protein S18 acetylase RimI-like enzyme
MITRELTINDSGAAAQLHVDAFKGFFLTSLGQGFLGAFYRGIIRHPGGIAVGIFENGYLIAFAVGSKYKQGFYSSLLKKSFITMTYFALPALITHPSKAFKLFKSLATKDTPDKEVLEGASLLSICVSPGQMGKGLGETILTAFEKIAFKNGGIISLTTDAVNNDYVNNFYRKNRYKHYTTFLQDNRKMNLYIKKAADQ